MKRRNSCGSSLSWRQCDQIEALQDQYGVDLQTVPDDIWDRVFDCVIRCSKTPTLELLLLRVVCKRWDRVVVRTRKLGISRCLNIHKVLGIFKFVSFLLLSQNISIDLSLYLPNLAKLSFFQEPGPMLDNGIKNLSLLTNLVSLGLKNHPFVSDNDITSLTNLKQLNLCSNGLISGSTIEQFTKLEKLDLSYNILIQDCSLSKMTSLKKLRILGFCSVTPSTIGALPNLSKLVSDRTDILTQIGVGTGVYQDGSKYVGQWQDYMKSGRGTYFGSDVAKVSATELLKGKQEKKSTGTPKTLKNVGHFQL